MADLERELRELEIAWPATPDLAGRVTDLPRRARGLQARWDRPGRPSRPAWRPAVAWTLALALAAVGAAMAASPGARSAVLEFLGLRSVRVERREPAVSPGAGLGLGERVGLARARASVGFPVSVPALLGLPDAVHLDRAAAGGPRVALVYAPRSGHPRLLVQLLEASATPLVEKSAGSSTRVARLRIGGDPAIFFEGAHGFAFLDAGGQGTFEEQRLAGNTLLVERAGVLVRIEGAVGQERAVALARSLR